ncbi:MAG: thiamine pyrophosphate-dependent enzyme, partial [Fusobacteriaceae bacterium]
MAPTNLIGQKSTTCQSGRKIELAGSPIKMSEMLATLDGATFVERVTVHNSVAVRKAKMIIKKAFENQISGKGFSIVEVLSTCPTNWGISPIDSLKWLEENMIPKYPLGNLKGGE